MRRLRDKLLLLFLLATLVPMGATLYVAERLLKQSLELAPIAELEESAAQLESTGRKLYQTAQQLLIARGGCEGQFRLDGDDLVLDCAGQSLRTPVGLGKLQATLVHNREVVAAHRIGAH